ncbi:hypothetical protein AB4P93_00180 (plasmid) [Pseudomonas sp. B26140]|uniref:hypothetical protein n=1 Tax=Pseudomonas sp. B26140 TaxID=3235112 RepID=UPI003782E169
MKNNLVVVVLTIIVTALTYWWGYSHGQANAEHAATLADNKRLTEAFEQGQALGTVKEKVVTEYVYRDRVIQGRTQTLIKQVPVYVSEAADRACVVPAGFVRLHDAAAANLPAPGPGGTADADPSGVALSAVAAVTVENYGTCNATANQLTALQAYIRGYQATTNQQAPK